MTQVTRFVAVMRPVSDEHDDGGDGRDRDADHEAERSRGSGFGTTDASAGRRLRPNEYWVRPIAMPTAASAKPQWKPERHPAGR